MKKFQGTGVALVTPFHQDSSIDFKSLAKLLHHVIRNRVEYLVLLGTTGESVTLSKDEKLALIRFTVETVDKKAPIVLGLGGNNTQEIINCLKSYEMDGIDAILSVSPYYNKPSQRGIAEHFKRIADTSAVPVILYNVPGRTSSNMNAETTLQLAEESDNIIGIKEASGNLSQIMQILKNRPEKFLVLSGDDSLTFPLMALGADGVISVTANAFPAEFSDMARCALAGEFDTAAGLHYRLLDFMEKIFLEGSPSGIKAALDMLGICNNHLRLPLVPVSKNTCRIISDALNKIKKNRKKVKA
ncbi:MAG: 4-hydroxy-tetrahydrodipicolinate synthase [Bacteroidetes bacterium]|nr:4-hydroxy-tetrahydrodipicolinate synthase [Bacteroidota bacterium]